MEFLSSLLLLISTFLSLLSYVNASQLRRLQESPDDTSFDLSGLRILTMGASATWGATLPDRYTAYPYQLKPANVTNLAIRSSGPNYPSICTESMIGDDAIYDVIILEYLMACRDGLETLALRLRQRFPDAIIIFNVLWVPTLLTGRSANNQVVEFFQLWSKYKFTAPLTPENIATIKSEAKNIALHPHMMNMMLSLNEKISQSVGGHLFGLEDAHSPEWSDEWVLDRLSLYNDPVHYSQKGHDYIANGIKKILSKLKPKPSNVLGTWGDGDACHMWYNTGEVNIDYQKEKINLVQFAPEKFALEIPYEGGEIVVNNPFSTFRHLMLTYMTTGPTSCIYPRVEVTLNGSQSKTFSIYPYVQDYRFDVHVAKTTNLDMIPPGENHIFIKPLELKGGDIKFDFRLVAVSVLGNANPSGNFAAGMWVLDK